jgi:hypothetical protein
MLGDSCFQRGARCSDVEASVGAPKYVEKSAFNHLVSSSTL